MERRYQENLMRALAAGVTILILTSTAAPAQSPYAGMQTRPIKALSAQQIDDLKAGRGMGLALAAELNGYPGPSHVLELSEKQEGALDQQFARRSITPDTLKEATAQIGATQAELRNAHLKYHLETAQILSPDQMRQYAELRGYTSGAPAQHHRMH
jgi:hypothetical protein